MTDEHTKPRSHRTLYLILAAAFVALAAVGAFVYQRFQADQQDLNHARALQNRFTAAGIPLPMDLNDIARMFRSDGGAVCANPDSALQRARWQQDLSNGADGPGQRPIISDRDIALADTLIIDTYCPDKLPAFRAKINELKLDDTAG